MYCANFSTNCHGFIDPRKMKVWVKQELISDFEEKTHGLVMQPRNHLVMGF